MSTTRPEREEDCGSDRPHDRQTPVPRTTEVAGAAEVHGRLELHLAQCRRRGSVLALLCVSVDAVGRPEGTVSAYMEQRVRQEVSNRIGNAVRASDAILRESDRDTVVVMPGADAGGRPRGPAPGTPGQWRLPRRRRIAAGGRAHRRGRAARARPARGRPAAARGRPRLAAFPLQCVAPSSASATNLAERRRFSSAFSWSTASGLALRQHSVP